MGVSARWADDPIRPSACYKVVHAILRIGEVNYCFLKGFGVVGCHDSSMAENEGLVNYIITTKLVKRYLTTPYGSVILEPWQPNPPPSNKRSSTFPVILSAA